MLLTLVAGISPAVESYLDNDVVKVGVDLAKGGSITYLSLSGTTNNIVNSYDLGRQIQQSYYSGPQPYNPSNKISPYYENWMWNPIQTGDFFNNSSLMLAQTNNGQTLYVKCRPMQWALDNVPGECTFESWIRLDGNVIIVSNRLLNARTDTTEQFTAYGQELPAVFTIGKLYRLFSYSGAAPFTGDALTNLPVVAPPNWVHEWSATENWAALVNTTNWGLGIYSPGKVDFGGGFYGMTNTGGPKDNPTGYMSPWGEEVLDSNIEYTYTYYLILGTVQQIRDWVYAQPRLPVCDFRFKTDRQRWWYENTEDTGWPITDHLRVGLGTDAPRMISPATAFAATNVPKLYIRAAYNMANPAGRNVGRVYWNTNFSSAFTSARSMPFAAINDGQFHIYELNLAATNTYTGFITHLGIDLVTAGDANDYADISWITALPPAEDQSVATLEDTMTNIILAANGIASTSLTYAILNNPTNGSLGTLNTESGEVSYTLGTNYNGSDSFTFTVSDGSLVSTGLVSINVIPVNDAPAADSQTVATLEDTLTNIVLAASDVDSTDLTYAILNDPTNGSLRALNTESGDVSYTPGTNYSGADSFAFTASDGSLVSTGLVSINVIPVNDAPVAESQTVATLEDTLTNIVLAASDVDSTDLTYAILNDPTNGSLGALNTESGDVSYTPGTNYSGADSFAFTASDGSLVSTGLVSINVIPVGQLVSPTLGITRVGSKVVIDFAALSGTTGGYLGHNLIHDLESCTNLLVPAWLSEPGLTNVVGDDSVKYFTNEMGANPLFFRLRLTLD